MKISLQIRTLRDVTDDELKAGGYYCLYGMNSHGPRTSYVNEVFNAIDVMTHEIQFRVTMCVATPIIGAAFEIQPFRSGMGSKMRFFHPWSEEDSL